MKARRALGIGLPVLLLAGMGGALAYADRMRPQMELGVGYAARVACACRFIGDRPLQDCYRDFEPGMEPIRLAEDAGAKAVTASVPLLTSRTVRYDPVLGCQPEAFRP
ncbi:hypothetical protein [Sphingomonas lenta]|uniref:Uncharacterized protein n=1 Tax=Sphingomonas lenta TaxID=1141887 RepID=A0A2A2SFH2_9SPHN|nr:hypothetical protein [Sphingomonas lenta]PAX07761.1 hypothetical protein CKY28_09000 [Sphingomonas lenta]